MIKSGKDGTEYSFSSFLQTQELHFRGCLIGLHRLIISVVPDAQETFSNQVLRFKQHYLLAGIGTNKECRSLYTMSSKLVKQIKTELQGCRISGMSIHFNPNEPLPVDIITCIVLARDRENELLAITRKKK